MSALDTRKTKTALLCALVEGDEKAWSTFVKEYEPLISAWCRLRSLSAYDVEEVTQRVLVKLAEKLPARAYQRNPTHRFRDWLFSLVRNEVIDHFREESKRPEIPLSHAVLEQESGHDGVDELIDALAPPLEEGVGHVRIVLEKVRCEVSDRDWELFWMVDVERHPAGETAKTFGLSPSAAGMARLRVRQRLRQELNALTRAST